MIPLISVVIPTRNRSKYLVNSVNTILEKCPTAQIVVSDNSDSDILRELLLVQIATGRVTYDYSSEMRSVIQNFEHAVSLARGDWLMILGDDDSIGPGLAEIVSWASMNQIEAVVPYNESFITSYYWPGVLSKYYGDAYASRLFIWPFTGHVFRVNSIDELKRVSNRFGGNLGSMPRIYHGLVSRALIDRILKRHGRLFGGVSPDIFSAALISAHSQSTVLVDFPFVIPGTSKSSTAGQGAERVDRLDLRETEHIARFGEGLKWDNRIPEFYSPQTVWAFSLLKALEELPELAIKPSYARLYVKCILYCHGYIDLTLATMWSQSKGLAKFYFLINMCNEAYSEISDFGIRLVRRALSPRAMGNADRIEGIDTIHTAYESLANYILKSEKILKLPAEDLNLKINNSGQK
jgi:glycosyltransferase involved in cell wall biosynthesis